MHVSSFPSSAPSASRVSAALARLGTWLPWLGIFLYGAWGLAFWVRHAWRQEWDSALYLLLGRSLAVGDGYLYLGRPFFLRPPGLPWLLSWTLQDGHYDLELLNRLVLVSAVAVLAATYLLLRPTLGRSLAALVAALVGTSPLFVRHLNWIVADLPFLALLLTSFYLFERATDRATRFVAWSLAGACVLAGAIYLRTVGIVALPALLLLGARRPGTWAKARGALPVAAVLLLCAPWFLYARRAAAAAPVPSEQLLVFTYSCALFHVDPGDPNSARLSIGDWLARALDNGTELVRVVARSVSGSSSVTAQVVVLALVGLGMAVAARAGPSLLGAFSAAYLLLVLVYFTFDVRLLVPLIPGLCLYLTFAIRAVVRASARALHRALPDRAIVVGLGVVVAAASLSQLSWALHPEADRLGPVPVGQVWEDQRLIAAWLAEHTPAEAKILVNEAPVLALLSSRTTATYRYARGPGLLDRYPSDYVVFYPGTPKALFEAMRARSAEPVVIPLLGGKRHATVLHLVR